MSKKIVNVLKTKVKGLKYQDLKSPKEIENEDNISSGHLTYIDLIREQNLTINGQVITNKFINELCLKHESLILEGENKQNNYRLFLNQVFREMFKHAGAVIPNNSIIEELITNYNQAGYVKFFAVNYHLTEMFELGLHLSCNDERAFCMNCYDPDCLELSFRMESIPVSNSVEYAFAEDDRPLYKVCDLSSSVEFKLKYKDGNVTYEDGKVLLTISKALEDYKAGNDSLLDNLTDIINKIVEYFKKLCEKLGFKFDTRIEYDSEHNIKMEHSLGKPLRVLNDVNTSHDKNLNLNS